MSTEIEEREEREHAEVEGKKVRAAELHEQVLAGMRAGRAVMWHIAEALTEFHDMSGWAHLGYESLGEWLADPDVTMTRRSFYRYVAVYREFVQRREIPLEELCDVDLTKADMVVGAVHEARVEPEKALADARSMAARDLREEYQLAPVRRAKPEPDEPEPVAKTAGPQDEGVPEPVERPEPAIAPMVRDNPTDDVDGSEAAAEEVTEPPEGESEPVQTIAGYVKVPRSSLDEAAMGGFVVSDVDVPDEDEPADSYDGMPVEIDDGMPPALAEALTEMDEALVSGVPFPRIAASSVETIVRFVPALYAAAKTAAVDLESAAATIRGEFGGEFGEGDPLMSCAYAEQAAAELRRALTNDLTPGDEQHGESEGS